MRSMGRVCADYEEKLMLKVDAAEEMYEALKAQHDAIDTLFAMLIARDHEFSPSKSGRPWEALMLGVAAIAKAEGR